MALDPDSKIAHATVVRNAKRPTIEWDRCALPVILMFMACSVLSIWTDTMRFRFSHCTLLMLTIPSMVVTVSVSFRWCCVFPHQMSNWTVPVVRPTWSGLARRQPARRVC